MKSYKHFTAEERISLAEKLKEGKSKRQIAREMGRSPSTISREIKRNFSKQKNHYHPWRATILYICRRKRCKRKYKIDQDTELKLYIIACLSKFWSPEIIANKVKEIGKSISFSTIYRAIKAKKLDGISERKHLRRRGKLKYKHGPKSNTITPEHTIHDRPAECERKERIGDFEGDTVNGALGKGCIVTLVDRKSRIAAAAKSVNREAANIRRAIQNAFKHLDIDIPVESITFDRGSEFADFKGIEEDFKTTVYFADPHSPWQRGLNENTNDLFRFFFPKGCDFLQISDEDVFDVVSIINNRPRKCLDYLSPLEFLSKKCCT